MGANIDFVSALLQSLQKPKKQVGLDDGQPQVPAMAPPAPTPDREAWRTQILPPQVPPATVAAPPVITPLSSANVIPDQPVTPGLIAPQGDPLEDRYKAITEKDYSIRKDPETGEVIRGKDRDKKWSVWEKVGSFLTGWATGGLPGGIKAGTDRNYFEKMGDEFEKQRLLPEIQNRQQIEGRNATTAAARAKPALARAELQRRINTDRTRFETQLKIAEDRGRRDSEKWVPYTDPKTGNVFKQYRNKADGADLVPLEDPRTGEQMQDPNAKLYDYIDPQTGTTVQLKGNQLATVGATIAAGNATRQQQVDIKNVDNQIEVQKTNVANAFNYSKELFNRVSEIAKTNGETQGALAAAQGLHTQLANAEARLQSTDPSDEKAYPAALKEFNDLQEKFYQAVAKTSSGATAVQQLTSQGIARPGVVTAPKVKAAIVGKPVPRSKDPLGLFR